MSVSFSILCFSFVGFTKPFHWVQSGLNGSTSNLPDSGERAYSTTFSAQSGFESFQWNIMLVSSMLQAFVKA